MEFNFLSIYVHPCVSVVSFSYVEVVIFIQIILKLLEFGTIRHFTLKVAFLTMPFFCA